MNVQVEKKGNIAKITVGISGDDFDKATVTAYNRSKNKFNVPGFRKGHVRKDVIERLYGPRVFFNDAVQIIIRDTYSKAMEESGLEIVSRPSIEVGELKPHEGFDYVATVALKPEVTLGQYKGVEVERAVVSVTDEEVEAQIKYTQNQNARMVSIDDPERTIKDGDIVVIDFDGSIGGVAFEGGKAEDYALIIGSKSFIDNFEDQLIGHHVGDEVDVFVTFPIPYNAKNLEGKDALFKVKIKEIKEKQLPDIDDEFASEVSEYETLDEYRDSVRADIRSRKEKEAVQENENRVIRKVVENASVDTPDLMVNTYLENTMDDFVARLKSQGFTMDQYLASLGISRDDFEKGQRANIITRLKTSLVLEKVVNEEGIKASDEALNERMNALAKSYDTDPEKVPELLGKKGMDDIRLDLAIREAVDNLVADAILKDPLKTNEDGDDPADLTK